MPSISKQFEQFHIDNPHVYWIMAMLAREWVKRTGRHKLGTKALFERARWEIAITTSDPDYKLNNNYTAYYARMLMRFEPDLVDIFNLRASDADSWLQDFINRGGRP